MSKLTASPRLNKLLYQMEIYDNYDVIYHLPRRYDYFYYSDEARLSDKEHVVLLGKVISVPKIVKTAKVKIVTFDFMSVSRRYYRIVAFNREYLTNILNQNDLFSLIGVYNKAKNEISLINIIKGEIAPDKAIRPIYNLPNDYPNHQFASLVNKSLKELQGKIHSLIPGYFRKKYQLVDKETALNYAHNPKNKNQILQAHRHLKYEEALMFSLKNAIIKEDTKSLTKAKKEPIGLESCEEFIKSLPYELTSDQIKASSEIINDMNQNSLMYRLLQGDVGTGKTMVSFIALFANYIRGDQGALMAPTDSLAKQHYKNALKTFEKFNIKIELLVGSTPLKKKREIYQDLADGTVDIVIGTHALFSKAVNYSSLGLVVIDEQHRFGVNQRIAIAAKGEHADLLMMSATPIPRSLALTLYGDLDISSLEVFPASKRDIKTIILDSTSERIYKAIDLSLKEGKQVYIVAPLISYREDGKYSVEKLFARFVLKYGNKVGLLHGKMKPEEKELALSEFYDGSKPILVTTQVIEVGIDVKKANLMIIYDAANFGLASLHQLRGRIGRDGNKAYCILTHDDEDEETLKRLNILVNSEDGFEIAEMDMKLRGPGELTGLKQSGLPNFLYINVVDDIKIFTVARDDAKYILKNRSNDYFKYIVDRAKKETQQEEIVKG